jgi:hypothetical protein
LQATAFAGTAGWGFTSWTNTAIRLCDQPTKTLERVQHCKDASVSASVLSSSSALDQIYRD